MFLRCHRLPFLHTSEINVSFASSTIQWDVDEYLYFIIYCSFAFNIANRIIETHPQHSRLPCLGVFYLSETQHILVYVSGPIRDTTVIWWPHQEIMVYRMFSHLLRAQRKIIATSVCAKTIRQGRRFSRNRHMSSTLWIFACGEHDLSLWSSAPATTIDEIANRQRCVYCNNSNIAG